MIYDLKSKKHKSVEINLRKFNIDEIYEAIYYPFDGHSTRLSHYYRHLLQTIRYIDQNIYINEVEKYDYVRTLRAQISNFEQLHLYYNATAWFMKLWNKYFINYKLIKNIPLELADIDVAPEIYFKKEIDKLLKDKKLLFERQRKRNI